MKLEERENYMSEFIKDIDKDLKNVIRKWAKDEQIPEIEYSRISLEMVMQGIGLDILEAVDLLYITSKDPLHGYEIFTRFARR